MKLKQTWLVCLICVLGSAPALADGPAPIAAAPELCRLIENLPAPKDPVRQAGGFRKVIRQVDADLKRTGAGGALAPQRALRHLRAMEKELSKVLVSATRAFELSAEARWSPERQKKAKTFLAAHVLTRDAVLRVGEFGFEPSPPVRALLLWASCWAGQRERLIAYGRGATLPDEGSARAMAALALERAARLGEARELLPALTGEGFLVAWAKATLSPDAATRRQQRAFAKRRASTPWQRAIAKLPDPPNESGP